MKRLIIFDMDGTLRWVKIQGQNYPLEFDQQALMPGVEEKLKSLDFGPFGYALGIASNQPGVGLGLLSKSKCESLIEAVLIEALGYLPEHRKIELCVCAPDKPCHRRKPGPGMLEALLTHFDTDDALYVGDLEIDRQAAENAGIKFIWAKDYFGN